MTLLHTQGFDAVSSIGDLNIYPVEFSPAPIGGASISTTGNKWGGKCVQMPSVNLYNINWGGSYHINLSAESVPVAETEMYFGFWQWADSYSASDNATFLTLHGSDGRAFKLLYNNSQTSPRFFFGSYGNETPVSPYGSAVINDAKWHWIEIKMKASVTSGSVAVYVDGILDVSFDGPTASVIGAGATYTGITLDGSGGGQARHRTGFPADPYYGRYDDIIVWNNLGADFNSFPIGAQRILTLPPTRDVSTQFSRSAGLASYALLDEQNFSPDTDYVESSNVGDKDYYGLQSADLPYVPETINAVVVKMVQRRTDYGPRTVRINLELSGTVNSSPELSLLQSYRTDMLYAAKTPAGAAWTATSLTDVTFGPEVVANI